MNKNKNKVSTPERVMNTSEDKLNEVNKTRPLSNPTLSETQCGEQCGDNPIPPFKQSNTQTIKQSSNPPHSPINTFPNSHINEFPNSPTNELTHSHINEFPQSNIQTFKHLNIQTFKEDPLFSDLQPLFDDQSRRLSALLSQPAAQLPTLNYRRALSFRRLMVCCWLPLAIFSLSVTIFWAFDLWNYNYDYAYTIYNIIAEIIFIVASIHATVAALSFLLHHPARTSLHSTLRYARFFNMYSPYMPQHSSFRAQRRQAKQPRTSQPPTPALQPATPDLHAVLTHFGRVACLCGILVLSLLTIACSPSPYAAPVPDLLSTQHLNQVINNIHPL
ncbi:MAG: hypothetical protein IK126_12260 [Bacteroidales bacterium]|nr:hypothetical protein [Bacteroidales bacterium]